MVDQGGQRVNDARARVAWALAVGSWRGLAGWLAMARMAGTLQLGLVGLGRVSHESSRD